MNKIDKHDHSNETGHDHPDTHSQDTDKHGHVHGAVDPSILTTKRGMWALKWSFIALFITAILQAVVVWYTGSVALFADTIHNFGDATTAIPLWIAFAFGMRAATKRFTYGYGRLEDLAGLFIVAAILLSATVAGYESIRRIYAPQEVAYLWAVAAAGIVGFIGNEAVAIFRIKVGKEIGRAALIADGYHARTDGLTSLAVLFGAVGVWLGFPLADPIVGLLITVMILKIVWDSAKVVFVRLLGGVDDGVVEEIAAVAKGTHDVEDVTEVRVQWFGHRMRAEVNIAVNSELSVTDAHKIAVATQRQLLDKVKYLTSATIHVDPVEASGESHHKIGKENNHPQASATSHAH